MAADAPTWDVTGLGNALVDALVRLDDDAGLLAEFGLARGEMAPLDEETWLRIYDRVRDRGVEVASGGSAANTIALLGLMGRRVRYRGQVGRDEFGELYARSMEEACGGHALCWTNEHPTGRCLSVVGAADAERTLLTHLGGAVLLPELGEEFAEMVRRSRLLVLTGYLLLDEPMASRAAEALAVAKEAGVPVSLDVADPFVVRSVRDRMWSFVREADIVFLNEEEARELVGGEPEAALTEVGRHADTVVLKLGARGSVVKRDGRLWPVPVVPVDAVDSTGAGDAFAAGYLYGHLEGWPPDRAAALGSRIAALTVSQLGAVVRDRARLARAIREVEEGA